MNSVANLQLITLGPRRVCYTPCHRSDPCLRAIGCQKRAGGFLSNVTRSRRLPLISKAASRATVCRSAAVDAAEAEADLMELELKVEGMVCDNCTTRVADALKAMSGVDKVEVNLSTGIATIELQASDPMDAAFNKMPKLVEKVGKLGFKAQAHFEDW